MLSIADQVDMLSKCKTREELEIAVVIIINNTINNCITEINRINDGLVDDDKLKAGLSIASITLGELRPPIA